MIDVLRKLSVLGQIYPGYILDFCELRVSLTDIEYTGGHIVSADKRNPVERNLSVAVECLGGEVIGPKYGSRGVEEIGLWVANILLKCAGLLFGVRLHWDLCVVSGIFFSLKAKSRDVL